MNKAEVDALVVGDVIFGVNPNIPDGGYRVDRYRVIKINPKSIVLERWPVAYPDRTSRITADKSRMATFGRSPEDALNAYVADRRREVNAAQSALEMAEEDLQEAMQFRASKPEAS